MNTRADRCATCGRPRGLSQRRQSWGIHPTVYIPRTGNPDDKPWQIANDLICSASVYRNGGTSSDTHLCDECLRIAVRALKVQLDTLLGELDEGHDKDAELAGLAQRVSALQYRHYMACFDHNRMQDRLSAVLQHVSDTADQEEVRLARWEVERGHIEDEEPCQGQ